MPESAGLLKNDYQPSIYEETFTVQYHETDQHGFVRLVSLLNYLQTAAVRHASLLNVSVAELRKGGHTWVLSRVHLEMDHYPRGGHTVKVRTWPASRITYFSVRDFELYDKDDNRIGRATTSWAVLNIESRKPAKLDDVLPEFPMHSERAIDDEFHSLPVLEVSQYELVLPVLRGDLDSNRHVNNTVYAAWALETVPESVDKNCRLSAIEMAFRAEALYGESIVVKTATSPETNHCYIHRIENSSGRELTRLITSWTPY